MPSGAYSEVIRGPAQRLAATPRKLRIDDLLVDRLLRDIGAGDAKDALPLLAFTLERLYLEFGGDGYLRLDDYERFGGLAGSIEAAVERTLIAADQDGRIPRDHESRLKLLRQGMIPWLAGIDPDTAAPRRRIARLSEIPPESRPMIDLLVEQRLLATDSAKETGATTIEPAHEALLRQWSSLRDWLKQDAILLTVLDGVKGAVGDWDKNGRKSSWLAHAGERLDMAEKLRLRTDLATQLNSCDKEYIRCCVKLRNRNRLLQMFLNSFALGVGITIIVVVLASDFLIRLNNVMGAVAAHKFGISSERTCNYCRHGDSPDSDRRNRRWMADHKGVSRVS